MFHFPWKDLHRPSCLPQVYPRDVSEQCISGRDWQLLRGRHRERTDWGRLQGCVLRESPGELSLFWTQEWQCEFTTSKFGRYSVVVTENMRINDGYYSTCLGTVLGGVDWLDTAIGIQYEFSTVLHNRDVILFGPKVSHIAHKRDRSVTFSDQISVHCGSPLFSYCSP